MFAKDYHLAALRLHSNHGGAKDPFFNPSHTNGRFAFLHTFLFPEYFKSINPYMRDHVSLDFK